MNEKEFMDLMNSMDDDLINHKIDDLLQAKGENVDMNSIKEKAMNKLNQTPKRSKIKSKILIGVAAAALTFSSVYAGEISDVVRSFFNKSAVYNTIVDGEAYYLPEELKLNDTFTLVNVSVSKGHLDMIVRDHSNLSDSGIESLDISASPSNAKDVLYTVGGYGGSRDGELLLSFFNGTEKNHNILPFKDFKLSIGGESYDVSLAKAESIEIDENFVIAKSENQSSIKELPAEKAEEITTAENAPVQEIAENIPTVVSVAGSAKENNGMTNIQIVAGFDDPDLKLRALGEIDFDEFTEMFMNNESGVISSSNSSMTKPMIAYDNDNNPYTLKEPKEAIGRPITIFETNAPSDKEITVKLPAILVGYEKQVTGINLEIPKEGESIVNQELDFIIQKVIVKSIKRTSEESAVVEFELNTGSDKSIFLENLGAYSSDVIQANTLIQGNSATMEMIFEKDIEKADFTFSWPSYIIKGNWSIALNQAE